MCPPVPPATMRTRTVSALRRPATDSSLSGFARPSAAPRACGVGISACVSSACTCPPSLACPRQASTGVLGDIQQNPHRHEVHHQRRSSVTEHGEGNPFGGEHADNHADVHQRLPDHHHPEARRAQPPDTAPPPHRRPPPPHQHAPPQPPPPHRPPPPPP